MEQNPQPLILNGITVRDTIRQRLALEVKSFSVSPKLVIIQVGEREDSSVYIKQKIKFGESVGVEVVHILKSETVTLEELKKEIEMHNVYDSVSGIIVQLPLPPHLKPEILEYIAPGKDVDCLTSFHQKKLQEGDEFSAPATARAILALVQHYNMPIKNKHVVVVGRSVLVGKPTAELFRLHGANVSVIHRQTEDPKSIAQEADILVVAAGVPGLVTKEWVNPTGESIIIDVGIHRTETGLVGDVDFASVSPLVSAISPVPGGVGPLTVACLFEQVVRMYRASL